MASKGKKRKLTQNDSDLLNDVGVVVIGRNEGERLELCLSSLVKQTNNLIIYVDSGSTDNSVDFAKSLGVHVEDLDTTIPFTMARGRNTGFQRLILLRPDIRYVQFVDGDCEVEPSWIANAARFLEDRKEVSVVCGSRQERFPNDTVYNTLVDLEWQGAYGEVSSCGGDAMFRTEIFQKSGGFSETMIAGEEPELCLRLRKDGGIIRRLNEKMVIHDAALKTFSQWWIRAKRAGYAYAEGVAMHGSFPYLHHVRELISILVYGFAIPVFWFWTVLLGLFVPSLSLLALISTPIAIVSYLKPFIGAFRQRKTLGNSSRESYLYAIFCVIAKFPATLGVLKYCVNSVLGRRSGVIEYKGPAS